MNGRVMARICCILLGFCILAPGFAYAVISLPVGSQFYSYPAAQSPVIHADASQAKPIGLGPAATGGSNLEINIKTEPFFGPVDVYFGVYSLALNPTEIYLFSEDGSIEAYSTAGLVRFRTAVSASFDEQLFGSIPMSLLPAGTYYLYFMVTPANSLSNSYLWETSVVVPDQTVNVPEGSAGFDGAHILAPGANILYQGELRESEAPVLEEENALVGIQKDGKTYLYHPAQGTVKLSEENSALAMLYFIAGGTARELNSVRAAQTVKSIQEQKVLTPPGSIVLNTGFKVEADSAGLLKVTNNLRRWAAVTSDQSKTPYYFIPRSNLLPTNVIDTFIRAHAAYQGGSFSISRHTRDDIKGRRLETFGAFWRAKFFRDDLTFRSDFKKAYERNAELTAYLNNIDFKMFLLTMVNSIVNMAPLECSDSIANVATLGIGNAIILNELGIQGWNDSFFAFSQGPLFDAIQSLVFCGIEAAGLVTTGGIGSAFVEFFTTAWDALNLLVTGIEELTVAPFIMRHALAYEDLSIGPKIPLSLSYCRVDVGLNNAKLRSVNQWGQEETSEGYWGLKFFAEGLFEETGPSHYRFTGSLPDWEYPGSGTMTINIRKSDSGSFIAETFDADFTRNYGTTVGGDRRKIAGGGIVLNVEQGSQESEYIFGSARDKELCSAITPGSLYYSQTFYGSTLDYLSSTCDSGYVQITCESR